MKYDITQNIIKALELNANEIEKYNSSLNLIIKEILNIKIKGLKVHWDKNEGDNWGAITINESYLMTFRTNFPFLFSTINNPILDIFENKTDFEIVFVEEINNVFFDIDIKLINDSRFKWRVPEISSLNCDYDDLWFSTL